MSVTIKPKRGSGAPNSGDLAQYEIAIDITNDLLYYSPDGVNNVVLSGPEQNDLTQAVTWANVPDANITQSSITQHQAALSITESQISDLQAYITDYTVTEGDVTAHQAALTITESQISDLDHYADADVDTHLNVSTASTNDYLKWNGADFEWDTVPAGYTDADAVDAIESNTADLQMSGDIDMGFLNKLKFVDPNDSTNNCELFFESDGDFFIRNNRFDAAPPDTSADIHIHSVNDDVFVDAGDKILMTSGDFTRITATNLFVEAPTTLKQGATLEGTLDVNNNPITGGSSLNDQIVLRTEGDSGMFGIKLEQTGDFAGSAQVLGYAYTGQQNVFQVNGNATNQRLVRIQRDTAGTTTEQQWFTDAGGDYNIRVRDNGNGTDATLNFRMADGGILYKDKDNTNTILELANNGNITFNDAYTFPTADGTDGQVLVTDGNGTLTFATQSGSGGGDLGDLDDVTITSVSDGQFLRYDNASGEWVNSTVAPGSGITDVVDDTTPQLGGDLDVNGNKIYGDTDSNFLTIGDDRDSTKSYEWSTSRHFGPVLSTSKDDIGTTHTTRVYTNGRHTNLKLAADFTDTNARYRANWDELHFDVNGFVTGDGSGGVITDPDDITRSVMATYHNLILDNTSTTTGEIGSAKGDMTYLECGNYLTGGMAGELHVKGDLIGKDVVMDLNSGSHNKLTVEEDIIGYRYTTFGMPNTHNGDHFAFKGDDSGAKIQNEGGLRIKGFAEFNDGMLLEGDLELDGDIVMVGSQIGIGNNLTIDSFGGINAGSLNANADSNFSMSVGTGYQFQFQAGNRDVAYYKEGEIELLTGLRLGNCTTGATDPVSATEGDLFINTTDSKLKRYNGTTWDDLVQNAGTTVFSTTDNTIVFYNGSGWRKVSDSAL